jgi:glycosyltransferase involved in cell wall biosynthesis
MIEQDSLAAPLTVIIPTYNRKDILRRTLAGYLEQSGTHLIGELLVVDDGSIDESQSIVAEFKRRATFEVRYLRQPNRGPAAARNLGLANASTPLVLYADDDIIPGAELVAQHVEWHRQFAHRTVAVLGYVTWSSEVHITPFMKWYGEGSLFSYDQLQHGCEYDFRYLYTCNISLKREFLQSVGGFDERFKMAAFEDTELGYRLSQAGLRLLYNSQAIGYHYQHFTFADACRKKRQAESAHQLFLQTEAGKRTLELQRSRDLSLRLRLAKHIAVWCGRAFQPLTKLLDSQLPLPGIVYRTLFWCHASARVNCRKSDGEVASGFK